LRFGNKHAIAQARRHEIYMESVEIYRWNFDDIFNGLRTSFG
jgi:hypothetical protein